MADISPGVDLARRQEQGYTQRLERRLSDRQVAETSSAQRAEVARATQQAQEARATQTTDDVRKLDAQQRLRNQQLSQDLQRIDQQRQDVADRAQQSNEAQQTAQPRGSIVDILA